MVEKGEFGGDVLSKGDCKNIERSLHDALVSLNKKGTNCVTIIEAVDAASVWQHGYQSVFHIDDLELDYLLIRYPLVLCAIASEIGFLFEGVGTEYWAKLSDGLGVPITMAQRSKIGDAFELVAKKYKISRPSESAFSAHFSIISWPIANALLPIDLIGPVTRLMARAPAGALPSPSRGANFASLRAWASAAEGARLVDWLRLEAPSGRALSALLTENRQSVLPDGSYTRLQHAIAKVPESFFSARAARLRAQTTKPAVSAEQNLGRLTLAHDQSGVRMYASWPALPPALFDEARATARAAGWRPRLWGAGGLLHPDTALSSGPFALALQTIPSSDDPTYPGAAEVFGAGSTIAAALAARSIDWNTTLLFDPNDDRTQAEQRFDLLRGETDFIWVATTVGGAMLDELRRLGSTCGYTIYEANLANPGDRSVLTREGLLSEQRRSFLARHPIDAIGAPQSVVRPDRPFLLYSGEGGNDEDAKSQCLANGARIAAVSGSTGRAGLRCEAAAPAESGIADLILFERDNIFDSLIERRLQLRVESRLPLTGVAVSADLEIAGELVERGYDQFPRLPLTVASSSPLLAPLYADHVRAKLLEVGRGVLRFTVGRSAVLHVTFERPPASVEWLDQTPRLRQEDQEAELVTAMARHPHRFLPAAAIALPQRGAAAFGLRLADYRIADPIQIFASDSFDLGDLAAHFGNDIGSRRFFDDGRGVGEIARARTAWARGLCRSLSAIAARTSIVRQFEEPLVIDLCGKSWSHAEHATSSNPTDPYEALWTLAIERDMAMVPDSSTASEQAVFAKAFRDHAKRIDPDWPFVNAVPSDGAMDDALNAGFSDAVRELHLEGRMLDVDPDDCDFGSVQEDWERAATDALAAIRRSPLVKLLAPSEGAQQLSCRSYQGLSVPELAEDLSAWTKSWALPRGQLDPDLAARSLLFWLSPAACEDFDPAVRVLAVDPFVARAVRYAALRLDAQIVEA